MTPDARLSWFAGITNAIARVAATVQKNIITAEIPIAFGKSVCGFLTSSAWNPAISIPAKRRTTVAKKGSVSRLISGTNCPNEKSGMTSCCPVASHQTPRSVISTAGMMLPSIAPKLLSFVEAFSPKYATAVVPQKAIIITENM